MTLPPSLQGVCRGTLVVTTTGSCTAKLGVAWRLSDTGLTFYFFQLTEKNVDQLLDQLRNGTPPYHAGSRTTWGSQPQYHEIKCPSTKTFRGRVTRVDPYVQLIPQNKQLFKKHQQILTLVDRANAWHLQE